MIAQEDTNNPHLAVGAELHGYRIESITPLNEINACCYRLRHLATGARHVHISTADQENTFGVTFKTVPSDSTGVAHILEHTVLCGSEKYPVRDPFFSMLKRSLSTFMNAFTASDWTMYPFSTQNPKDFRNLMDVYLDATFFPNIEELSFKQEGHRLDIESDPQHADQQRLVYKGVVYNEMKGAMSSPDQVMGRSMLNALYPDTTYSYNSGGEPKVIPKLTHAQLKNFHQRHYHPSNAYFYTYGNLPLEQHLEFIAAKIMSRFKAIDPKTDVPSQPRWQQPKTVHYTYNLAPTENPARKSQVCIAWLVSDIRNTFEALVFTVLEQVLLGNAASPLRKALMDSGLGSALSDGTGFDGDNRDTLFSCGLKETDESCADQIEKLIFDVLNRLAKEGIEKELVDSAIHQIEFHRKEITNTPYPYGLKLLLTSISTWLHGGDPERVLQLDADLKQLQTKIKQGPLLEQYIQEFLIDNPHRIRMTLTPDQQASRKEEERVAAELAKRKSELTEADLRQIEQDAAKLTALQESQEDISCLPTLALSDIPPQVSVYAHNRIADQVPLWCYVQPTSGIFYLTITASASVREPLLPYVPFLCYAFSKSGTRKHTYGEMARRIDAATGGLTLSANARAPWNQPQTCLPLVSLNAKCLARNIDPTLAIIEEFIESVDFSDLGRLEQLLGEYQAGLESMIVHNGHRLAISLSARNFSPSSALNELWGGVHHIRAIRTLSKDLNPSKLNSLAQDLDTLAREIFKPGNIIMAAIGEEPLVDRAMTVIENSDCLKAFRRSPMTTDLLPLSIAPEKQPPYEGWSTSSAVSFVARTMAAVPLGHPDAPSLAVLSKLLRSLYLHREIREKGGAYGGFALYNPESGLFSLASYRDPHIVRTLDVFDGIVQFMKSNQVDEEDVKEAVLQVCSEIDKPDPPGPAARKAFSRLIVGLTDDVRNTFKRQLLDLSLQKISAAVEKYFDPADATFGMAVISGQDQLEQANSKLAGRPLTLSAIK